MIALLLTVDFPPNKGGVSRYYEGLVASSYPKIGIAGVDLGEKPPEGKSLKIRLKQIFWAKNIIKQTPTEIKILVGQPHLAISSIIAIRRFALFIHGGEWGDYPLGAKLVKLILYRAKVLITNSNATYKEFIPKSLQSKTIILKPGLSDFSSIKNEQDYNRNTDTIKKDFVNSGLSRKHSDVTKPKFSYKTDSEINENYLKSLKKSGLMNKNSKPVVRRVSMLH